MSTSRDRQEWDSRYAASERVWSAAPNRWVAATIGAWFTGAALDLGAADGRHSVWLASLGWQVTAVDFSAEGIKRGRRGAQEVGVEVDWVVSDVRTWEPPAALTFDLVLVAYLQLGDDQLMLLRDWLAPGGAMVVIGHGAADPTDAASGPCDERLLYTQAGYRAASGGLVVEQLGEVGRQPGDGEATDLVLVARRPMRAQR